VPHIDEDKVERIHDPQQSLAGRGVVGGELPLGDPLRAGRPGCSGTGSTRTTPLPGGCAVSHGASAAGSSRSGLAKREEPDGGPSVLPVSAVRFAGNGGVRIPGRGSSRGTFCVTFPLSVTFVGGHVAWLASSPRGQDRSTSWGARPDACATVSSFGIIWRRRSRRGEGSCALRVAAWHTPPLVRALLEKAIFCRTIQLRWMFTLTWGVPDAYNHLWFRNLHSI